jgi:hypothetical protein
VALSKVAILLTRWSEIVLINVAHSGRYYRLDRNLWYIGGH